MVPGQMVVVCVLLGGLEKTGPQIRRPGVLPAIP